MGLGESAQRVPKQATATSAAESTLFLRKATGLVRSWSVFDAFIYAFFSINLVTLGLYIIAAISGWVGPQITPRVGQRGLSIAGFAIVLVALLVAAAALYTDRVGILPFAAAAMLWGHYWDAENVVTIPAMVAKPEYRGTATGFAYIFVKLPAFLSIFLFPVLFSAIGQANATLFTAVFPLVGLLAAIFILPEVYGFEQDSSAREMGASPAPSGT